MQTSIDKTILATAAGQEMDAILRRCVHCGFCTATCPTYQLLGDELDGPRGRIYLIKQFLEGTEVSTITQQHLDKCLLCRSCETTCPSGVEYGRLVELSRPLMLKQWQAPLSYRLPRKILAKIFLSPKLFNNMLRLGRWMKWFLPDTLQRQLNLANNHGKAQGKPPAKQHQRKMLLLDGCVQPGLAPSINLATKRIFDRLGIQMLSAPKAKCCGAVPHHMQQDAEQVIRQTIDAFWPFVEEGVEAIVSTASACSLMLKQYAELMADDEQYAAKAERIAGLVKDVAEVLAGEDLTGLQIHSVSKAIAYHPPCTQQHGLKMPGKVEALLTELGFKLVSVAEKHLCCGSAGTYSIFQKDLSIRLRARKLVNLQRQEPALIATANIGCITHLAALSEVPVVHWIQLLDKSLPLGKQA